MAKPIIALIRSGGQTGTDRAALLAGRAKKYPISGWCPKGGWAEDMLKPPGLRAKFPEMTETPDEEIMQRTEWNVRDSHVTVVIGGLENSFGTAVTSTLADAYERPFIIVGDESPREVMEWLESEVGRGLTVNFAGPRESESPGIQRKAYDFICEMIDINNAEPESDPFAEIKAATEVQMSFSTPMPEPKREKPVAGKHERTYPTINGQEQASARENHPEPKASEDQGSRPTRMPDRKAVSERPAEKPAPEREITLDDLSFPDDDGDPKPAGKPSSNEYVDPFDEFADVS